MSLKIKLSEGDSVVEGLYYQDITEQGVYEQMSPSGYLGSRRNLYVLASCGERYYISSSDVGVWTDHAPDLQYVLSSRTATIGNTL